MLNKIRAIVGCLVFGAIGLLFFFLNPGLYIFSVGGAALFFFIIGDWNFLFGILAFIGLTVGAILLILAYNFIGPILLILAILTCCILWYIFHNKKEF